jgi:hypothetical protein
MIIFFGYLLSLILVKKMHLTERFGTSFLLGFGVFTLLMFCYSTLGLKITLLSTVIALLICITVTFFIAKIIFKRNILFNPIDIIKSFIRLSKLEKILVLAIAGLGVGSLIITTYFPVYIWDALALYDFRGRIIAQQGFYTQIVKNFVYFDGYPLFTSLSHTLVYLFGGKNPQFLYSLIYLSFIFIFYGILREFVNKKAAMITTLILATTPVLFDHSTFAYTNLPYTAFLVTGSLYLYLWLVKEKPIGYLILSAILTGLSTWTRSAEPFWAINLLILVLFSMYKFKKYILPTFIYAFFLFLIKQPWSMVVYAGTTIATSEIGSYASTITKTTFDATRIIEVMGYIYKNIIVSWFPLIFLFLFCIFINLKKFFKRENFSFLLIIFSYFALLLFATYLFSFNFSGWTGIPDSAKRMAMFFMPLMIFYIGLQFRKNT